MISVINMKTTFRQLVYCRGKETLILTYHFSVHNKCTGCKVLFYFLKNLSLSYIFSRNLTLGKAIL